MNAREIIEGQIGKWPTTYLMDALKQAGFTITSKEDVEAVREAMDKVIEFDWSDNDDDAVLALYDLYAAIRSLKSSTP